MLHINAPCVSNMVMPQIRRPAKLLVSVTVRGSVGPVQVVMSPENTVGELIKVVVDVYEKEKRRPLLNEKYSSCFELHYSPFSLDSLKLEEKLFNLESRNFFLCQKPITGAINAGKCFDKQKKIDKFPFPLVKLMDFLL